MANPADYKRAAVNLNARPDRGGMLGAAARMRDAMASGALRNRGIIGLAQAMRPQQEEQQPGMKKGGKVKKAKGGTTREEDKGVVDRALGTKLGFSKGGSASKRADGCATKGKTKGRFV